MLYINVWKTTNKKQKHFTFISFSYNPKHIGGVMASMLTMSVVDFGFKLLLCQTKDYKIDICCFSAKQASLE